MQSKHVYPASLAARVLYRLVSIPSPTGQEEAAVEAFTREAEALGLEAWIDGAGNAFAAPPMLSGEPLVMLAGHIDTVEGWLAPGMDEAWVWGRGAVDAKGPLASMLVAAARLASRDPGAPVLVAALVGEEGDSRGARHVLAQGPRARFAIIGEPTGGDGVVIGYRGSARVVVECVAFGGHPASPWVGSSALELALELLEALRRLYPPIGVSRPTVTPVMLRAGDGGNVLPTRATIILDLRIPPGHSLDGILEEIESATPQGCTARLAGNYTPPVRVSLNDPVPRALVRALLANGVKPRPAVKAGTSDMNLLAAEAESLAAYGPGDPSLAHTQVERVRAQDLALAVRVYEEAVEYLVEKYT